MMHTLTGNDAVTLTLNVGQQRIAASLADPGIAVNLRENLGNLDRRNIALVTDAITAANG